MASLTVIVSDVVKLIESMPNDGKLRVIGHQGNCQNCMGKGIAGVLAKAYPILEQADNQTIAGDRNKLGTYTYARIKPNVVVCNLYGQYNYGWLNPLDSTGRQTDYIALQKALTAMRDDFAGQSTQPIAFYLPRAIGSGLAKGNYNTIRGILEEVFKEHELVLFYN